MDGGKMSSIGKNKTVMAVLQINVYVACLHKFMYAIFL